MVPTFLLLAAAVLALWLPDFAGIPVRRSLWLTLLAAALVAGFIAGLVGPFGGVATVVFGVLVVSYYDAPIPVARALLAMGMAIISTAFMLHRVPGFLNPRVINAVHFTPDALPFSLYLNFDKTLVGLFILGFGVVRARTIAEWRMLVARAAPVAAATITIVLLLSLALGYVRFAPKLPSETGLWAAVNLLGVCTAEEALFRGFLQTELGRLWAQVRGGRWFALAVAAVAFGLAHAAGGWIYVALATIASAGYGLAYLRTGRIEAAILTHFTLNTLHFLLFTYPALASHVGG